MISGRVVTGGDLTAEARGQGVAGAAVSDGGTTVLADAEGRYELDTAGARPGWVTVSPPLGWALPRRWFVVLGQDQRVVPDLVLTPTDHPPTCRMAHISDLHISRPEDAAQGWPADRPSGAQPVFAETGLRAVGDLSNVTALVRSLHANGPDAVVCTGDVSNNADPGELAAYAAALDAVGVPVLTVPGNHDHHRPPSPHSGRAYVQAVGPRWFGVQVGGVRVVGLDWWSWHHDVDAAQQRRWLSGWLEQVSTPTPLVVLAHDVPDGLDEALGVAPDLVLTGHWHIDQTWPSQSTLHSRSTLHARATASTVGGLDGAPPKVRIWSIASTVTVTSTRTAPPSTSRRLDAWPPPARPSGDPSGVDAVWTTPITGVTDGTTGTLLAHDDVVIVTADRDDGYSTVSCIETASGAVHWTAELGFEVRATPAVAGDTLVMASNGGALVGLDLADGTMRWSRAAASPAADVVLAAVVPVDDDVIVHSPHAFRRLTRTGDTVWQHLTPTSSNNIVSPADAVILGDLLAVPFWSHTPDLILLDLETGNLEGQLRQGHDGRVRADGFTSSLACAGEDLVGVTFDGRLQRWSVTPLQRRWQVEVPGWFTLLTPLVHADSVILSAPGRLQRHDLSTGDLVWTVTISGDGPLPLLPYERRSSDASLPPLLDDDLIVLPLCSGRLLHIDLLHGAVIDDHQTGVRTVRPWVRADGVAVGLDLDGVVSAVHIGDDR